MNLKPNEAILAIHVNIRFRGSAYQLRLANVLKWLVPTIVVIARVLSNFRRDGP